MADTDAPPSLHVNMEAAPFPEAAAEDAATPGGEEATASQDSRWWIVAWLIGLVAVIIAPGWITAGYSVQPFALRFDMIAATTAIVAVFAVALAAILSRGFRHGVRWALGVTTIVTFALFQWTVFTTMGNVFRGLPLLPDLIPVAVAAVLIWMAVRRAGEKPFGILMGALGIGVIVALAVLTAPLQRPTPHPLVAAPAAVGAPDTIVLVLDGYVRDDVLDEQFGFDNTPFIRELEARGFFVAREATANYNSTFAALSSMLAQGYTYEPGPVDRAGHDRMRDALAGDAALVRQFKEGGYSVGYVENAWEGSLCSELVDVCVRDGLFTRAAWYLGRSTIFAQFIEDNTTHPYHAVSYDHLTSLAEIASRSHADDTPRLTIAHVILPHPPYHLDAACRQVDGPGRRGFTTRAPRLVDTRRAFYFDQMTCTNNLLLGALDEIIAAHPDVHVMITADHGSATTVPAANTAESRSDEVFTERMAIFSAYRLPDCEAAAYPGVTPVNGTRLVANCALGTNLDLVEDRNYWIPPNRVGSVVDVGWRLGK